MKAPVQRKHLLGTDTIRDCGDDVACPYSVGNLPIGDSDVFGIQPSSGFQHRISSAVDTLRRTRCETSTGLDSAIVRPLPGWSRVLPVSISFHVLDGCISQIQL